jgi:hypothetical protein
MDHSSVPKNGGHERLETRQVLLDAVKAELDRGKQIE